MDVNFAELSEYQRYKLMASLIVPRPIALVTSLNAEGVINAAPFSMFNMLGEEPPLLMISVNRKHDGGLKDTANNILHSGEFVVHIADEEIAEKMHRCGDALPSEISELGHAGFSAVASSAVAPPRIAEAPVAFECRLWKLLETESRQIFIGEVLWLHAREGLIDSETWRVRLQDFFPVGRFGASFYTRTRDRFVIGEESGTARTTPIDEI